MWSPHDHQHQLIHYKITNYHTFQRNPYIIILGSGQKKRKPHSQTHRQTHRQIAEKI